MSNTTIQLSGYFDNNFGDDYMMKVIAHSVPDFDFVIDENEKVNPVLLEEQNVRVQKDIHKEKYPKLVVTGCGFMINSGAALFTELIFLIKRKNPGDYCLGCNIEPLDSQIKKRLIINKLNKFKLIVCRDKNSLLWLNKYVSKPQKEYLPDILFGMPDEWLYKPKKGNKLGISVLHRKDDKADCAYYKSMAQAADFWVEKNSGEVVLMAFNTGSEDDVYSCECVKKLMKYPEKAKITAHKNGKEIPEAYSECAKIIGARFHSAVLALKMELPFFPVVYREKMKNLIEDLSYPVTGCSIDRIEQGSIKAFLSDEVPYKLNEHIISASLNYKTIFKEVFGKGRRTQ